MVAVGSTSRAQGVLPLTGRTLCGYCLTPLAAADEIDGQTFYECPECAPCLAGISTVEDWTAFQKAAGRRRKRRVA